MTSTAARAGASGGFGVGGGTFVWTGAAFRLLDHDFTVLSRDGPVAGASIVDWPLGYREMAPYHDAVEEHIGVSGAVGPWEPSDRRPYPYPPHGYHMHSTVLEAGFMRLGLRPHPGPVAILSHARPGREACCSCGFCMQGYRTGAMYSTATAEIPAALATGRLDLRPNAVALRVFRSADGTSAEAVGGRKRGYPFRGALCIERLIGGEALQTSLSMVAPTGFEPVFGHGRVFARILARFCVMPIEEFQQASNTR